jgi:hypothetical protein
MIAGATSAAAILAGGGVTAGASVATGGATAGTAVAVGGGVSAEAIAAGAGAAGTILVFDATGAATVLTTGAAAAGAALWGPIGILVAAVAAIGAATFLGGGDDEVKKAQETWKGMTDQIVAFNHAAAGFSLGPLTNELDSMHATLQTLSLDALEAKDYAGLRQLQHTFNEGVSRVVQEFENGATVLSPLATSMKAVSDEAAGLKESLTNFGLASVASFTQIDAALSQQIANLKAQATESFISGAIADINSNSGKGYINDIAAAVTKLSADLKTAAELGGSDALTYLANQDFATKVQSVVDGAQLIGSAFDDMVAAFPQIAGLVHESAAGLAAAQQAAADAAKSAADAAAATAQAAADAAAALAKTNADLQSKLNTLNGKSYLNDLTSLVAERSTDLAAGADPALVAAYFKAQAQSIIDGAQLTGDAFNQLGQAFPDLAGVVHQFVSDLSGDANQIQQYLDNLRGGSGSTLAPVDKLAAADATYSSDLAKYSAHDPNVTISQLTQASDNYIAAARGFFGSTSGFQNILAGIESDLSGLIGGTLGSVTATSSAAAQLTGATSSVVSPALGISTASVAPPAPANGNTDLPTLFGQLASRIDAQTAEIVVLKTTLKAAVDLNTQKLVEAHLDEKSDLEALTEAVEGAPGSPARLAGAQIR